MYSGPQKYVQPFTNSKSLVSKHYGGNLYFLKVSETVLPVMNYNFYLVGNIHRSYHITCQRICTLYQFCFISTFQIVGRIGTALFQGTFPIKFPLFSYMCERLTVTFQPIFQKFVHDFIGDNHIFIHSHSQYVILNSSFL